PILTESDKRRLAQKGKELNDFLLAAIEPTWAPGTIRKWYSDLVGAKYNSVNEGQKKRGRKPISPEIVEKVLQLAKSNPDWGYEHTARNISGNAASSRNSRRPTKAFQYGIASPQYRR
ncbi:helix-turn-helix domain-containing protein, partial [bacterium]|nr:helix-turn-helix domain-containing protein [bacterium]